MESRWLLSTFTWFENVNGAFDDPARWRDEAGQPGVPGAADDAVIDFDHITVTSAGAAVNSLVSRAALTLTGGTFRLANAGHDSTLGPLTVNAAAILETAGGTTTLTGGGQSQGRFDVADGATLHFGNTAQSSTYLLLGDTPFSGPGLVRVGDVNFSVLFSVTFALRLPDRLPQNFEVDSGALVGRLTITGTVNWTGGFLGDTTVAPGGRLNLSGPADKHFAGGLVENRGTISWGGTGDLQLREAFFFNYGTFAIESDQTVSGDGPFSLVNLGAMTKSSPSGTGTTRLELFFTQVGTLRVESGVLQ
jgi:hypothetical protein